MGDGKWEMGIRRERENLGRESTWAREKENANGRGGGGMGHGTRSLGRGNWEMGMRARKWDREHGRWEMGFATASSER